MKALKTFSALLLILSIAFGIFSGCDNNTETTVSDTETTSSVINKTTEKKQETETPTTATTVYYDENYTYHSVVYQTEKKTDKNSEEYTYAVIQTTEFVPITIITTPKTTKTETTKATESETAKKPPVNKTTTTRKTGSTEPIKEIANGLSVLTKTTPVIAGNSATITIMGNPNHNYSIEFYEEGSTPSVTTGLETKKSDASGFVSWTFSVSPLCSAGPKKIVIKENGTNNYIQTSITIM